MNELQYGRGAAKKSLVVSEIKLSVSTFARQRIAQKEALIAHAQNYEYIPLVLLIAFQGNEADEVTALEDYATRVIPYLVTLTGGRSGKR